MSKLKREQSIEQNAPKITFSLHTGIKMTRESLCQKINNGYINSTIEKLEKGGEFIQQLLKTNWE